VVWLKTSNIVEICPSRESGSSLTGGQCSLQKVGEFRVCCLRFFQSFWGDCCAHFLHARQSVGDHVVLPRDVADVCRELRNDVEVVKLPGSALIAFLAESVGQWLVVGEDHEVPSFQHVSEVLHRLVDGRQLSVVGTILLCAVLNFFEKNARGCQVCRLRCCNTAPMAVIEASVTKAMGVAPSGLESMANSDRMALHSSKAWQSAGVQSMECEPLVRGPARRACRGDCVAAA